MKIDYQNTTEERIDQLAQRCTTSAQYWRVWNWIDHQTKPERLWAILAVRCYARFEPSKVRHVQHYVRQWLK